MFLQTTALFADAYRELAAKKIFWISLAISGVLVLSLAAIGYSDEGHLTLLWYDTTFPLDDLGIRAEVFYKFVFMTFGLGIWLTWGATILALASTAGMFPDFLAGGAIDLALSKPIGRVRLYLTKFASALLFAALQVFVFTALSFFVIGWRGGSWEPALFLAVPLVVMFFSYLYCVCALFGVLTRSAVTSLILTLVVWFAIFVVHGAESALLTWRTNAEVRVHIYETTIAQLESRDTPAEAVDDKSLDRVKRFNDEQVASLRLDRARASLAEAQESEDAAARYHRLAMIPKTLLPKTAETIGILERVLIDAADMVEIAGPDDPGPMSVESRLTDEGEFTGGTQRVRDRLVAVELQEKLRTRSAWWILGTSLLFEAGVLALGAWRFSRKDY